MLRSIRNELFVRDEEQNSPQYKPVFSRASV